MRGKFAGRLNKLLKISIVKTLRFNLHYFGFRDGMKLPVLVSRNFVLLTLKGNTIVNHCGSGYIRLGFGSVGIFDKRYDRGIWENDGTICFNGRCSFGHGSKISNHGQLIFGADFMITAKSEIVCRSTAIQFGEGVLVSWDSLIMDTDWHNIYSAEDDVISKGTSPDNADAPIAIGNHVWIGCRSVILKGSKIADNCVIAANSTITKDFGEENTLVGGTNKILKSNIRWD